jgi:hypothetical protein
MTCNNMNNLDGFNLDKPLIQLIFAIQLVLSHKLFLASIIGWLYGCHLLYRRRA